MPREKIEALEIEPPENVLKILNIPFLEKSAKEERLSRSTNGMGTKEDILKNIKTDKVNNIFCFKELIFIFISYL
jgi:hypothetical protein